MGHIIAGAESPTTHPFVKTAFEGAKRLASRGASRNREEPLETNMLTALFDAYGHTGNVLHLRFLVVCFLGFTLFLRIGELLQIQLKHLTFNGDHMTIFIPESKTDKLREGETVYISRQHTRRCPVAITQRFIQLAQLGESPDDFLISRLAKTKKGHKARGKYPLSSTRVRENFKVMVGRIMPDKTCKVYSLHSLRSGGASVASANGISDRPIGKHGRLS